MQFKFDNLPYQWEAMIHVPFEAKAPEEVSAVALLNTLCRSTRNNPSTPGHNREIAAWFV